MRCVLAVILAGLMWCAVGVASDAERVPSKFNRVLAVGDDGPAWRDLPGTDGKTHALADLSKARCVAVLFICNHCPMSKAYESRMIEFARKYRDRKVEVVAISVSRAPGDSLDKMKLRADERGFPFLYLHDESQQIGRKYGALVTPQVFLLDDKRRVAFMGAFDDHEEAGQVKRTYLVNAVESLLRGEAPEIPDTRARGCPIDYEDRNSSRSKDVKEPSP